MVLCSTCAGCISGVTKRVLFCTYPGLYSEQVLRELTQLTGIELVGVVFSSRHGYRRRAHLLSGLDHWRCSGWAYAGYLWLVTQGYSMARFLKTGKSWERSLREQNIPVHCTADINQLSSVNWIEQLKPDVLVCAHFNQWLSPRVLELPNVACVNLHPSLLPDLKGVDPAFYALLRDRPQTGVTLHQQTEAFDEGALFAQQSVAVMPDDSLLSLNSRLFAEGALVLGRLLQQPIPWSDTPQFGVGCYDSWPGKSEVRRLRQRRALVSWRSFWQSVRQMPK